jgi:hypothetical protein
VKSVLFRFQRTAAINRTICAITLLRAVRTSRKFSANFTLHFIANTTDTRGNSIQYSVFSIQMQYSDVGCCPARRKTEA